MPPTVIPPTTTVGSAGSDAEDKNLERLRLLTTQVIAASGHNGSDNGMAISFGPYHINDASFSSCLRTLIVTKALLVERAIHVVGFDQVGMGSLSHQASLIHHQHLIGIFDGRQTMCDHKGRFTHRMLL